MSPSVRIPCFTGTHAMQPLRAGVRASAGSPSSSACCWVRAHRSWYWTLVPAVSTVLSGDVLECIRKLPLLVAFSLADREPETAQPIIRCPEEELLDLVRRATLN